MSLLEDFRSWHIEGNDIPASIINVVDEIQNVLFTKIKKRKRNYYADSGTGDEDTFLLYFAEKFWDKKFVPGLDMICGKEDDQAVRTTIYFLMNQFYNHEFSSEEVKELKSIVKHICNILEENNLITQSSSILTSYTRLLPVGKFPSFKAICKLFSPQFLKNQQKYQVLVIASEMISTGVRYTDLMNELKSRLQVDQNLKESDEIVVDPSEDEIQDTEVEFVEDTEGNDQENDEETADEVENFEFAHSVSYEEVFLSPDAEIICFTDERALVAAYNKKYGDDPRRTGNLESLLAVVGFRQLSVFVLTKILGGLETPAISLEVRGKIYQLLKIGSTTYYNDRIKFEEKINSFARSNPDDLTSEEIRDTIGDIISLYNDLNEEEGS